ncbi:TetR/AcrR family transcriptional regulator [Paraburkholderia aspalathi]|uniref:TetR/AcrR family transcriptional regulator n=1 Tax=Paraburkholderia aspalathi TaxID=1324617 RepID=UPI0038BBCEA5
MSRGTSTAAKEAASASSSSVRERILDTAAELFYQEGVRAVGVDLVVERSGVAKTSLYRHFTTKDDLVAAVLERDDANYWADWDKTATRHRNAPRDELTAHLKWIARDIAAPKYRGCPFLNVATEFPAPDHPARVVALRHKVELRRRLGTLAKQIGVARPDNLANQIALLIDGAYVYGQLANKEAAQPLLPAVLALISVADNPG